MPDRRGTWLRSDSATSMLCNLGPHFDLSVLSFCKCIYQWSLGRFIKVLLGKGKSDSSYFKPGELILRRGSKTEFMVKTKSSTVVGVGEGLEQESTQKYHTITCSSQMLVNRDLLW